MKLMIIKADLTNYKSRDEIPMECEHCHKIFCQSKSQVLAVIKGNTRTKFIFCSQKCWGAVRNLSQPYKCEQCQKEFTRTPNQCKKSKHLFCSRSCAASYNNTHKINGYRRSKLEKWIEEQLILKYPNLSIEYNKINTINSELDIYIPSLKLAFELNGIFHYEPIYGEEKLKSIRTNDERKFQACLENGIELCILDVHSIKYFKTSTSLPILEIITNIIDRKLMISSDSTSSS